MKNILKLFLVITILLLNVVVIKADSYNMLKKLYIIKGSYDTLSYPGYKLIESDIDYDKEGIYHATYQEDITDRVFTRELEVIKEENFEAFGIKNINTLEEYQFENMKVLKRVKIDTVNVFVLEDEFKTYLLFMYKEDSKTITLTDEFGFIDLVYNEELNKLYLTGTKYIDSVDIYLAEYGLNGELLKEKVISGSGVDLVNSLTFNNDYLYLVGSTTSADLDFNHICYAEDSFVLQIDIKTFNIISYLNLGENGIDYIKVSAYLDNLYVIKHYYNSGLHLVKLYKLDSDLNLISSNFLGTLTFISDIKFKGNNEYLYYFCSVYNESLNDDEQVLYRIDKKLQIKKLDSYYDEYSVGKDLNIVKDEINLLYTSSSKDEFYPTYLRILNKDAMKFTLDNRKYDNCYFNEFGNLDLLYGSNLKSYEYSLVYPETLGSEENLNDVTPVIMCNNHNVIYNQYLSKTYLDKNTFGNYELIYYYNFDFFDLVYKKDIEVKSDVLIDSDNIYTNGLVLEFKGIGYLNNNIIESGYIITEEGAYKLVVVGANSKTEEYEFEVINNSSIKQNIESRDLELVYNLSNEEVNDSVNVKASSPINNIVSKDYQSNIWYIVIPILTLIVSLTTTLFIGRKIR